MDAIVIYQSKYGATRQYAMWLSEALKCPMVEAKDKPNLEDYDTIIIGSGVYMGKMQILGWINKNKKVLDKKNTFTFSASRFKNDKGAGYTHFHLPGRLKLSELKGMDRLITKMVGKKAGIEDFDSVDKKEIDSIVARIKNG